MLYTAFQEVFRRWLDTLRSPAPSARRARPWSRRMWGPGVAAEILEQRQLLTTVTLNPVQDNTLFEDPQGDVSDGAGVYLYVGTTNQGGTINQRRAVLEFDIAAQIPAGATINSVSLVLNLSKIPPGATAQTLGLYELLADWGEGTSDSDGPGNTLPGGGGAPATAGDATWLYRFFPGSLMAFGADATWTTAGGDFNATADATQSVNGLGSYSWTSATMVATVQSWLDNPQENFGWLMRNTNEATSTTARRFDSRQHSVANNRPRLVIDYSLPVEPSVSVSVTPGSVEEDGTPNLSYTFTRTGPDTAPLTVQFAVSGTAVFDEDYSVTGAASFLPGSGMVVIPAGQMSATITLDPLSDQLVEPDETVTLTVTAATGYTVGETSTAQGVLANDDTQFSVTVFEDSVTEGDSGTTEFTFTITRTGKTTAEQAVDFSVVGLGLHAADANDFLEGIPSDTVVFPPDVTSRSITIQIAGDQEIEEHEGFTVVLSNPTAGSTLGTAEISGTILNDDAAFTLDPTTVPEGNALGTTVGTFTSMAPGAGEQLTYALVAGEGADDNAAFVIDGISLKTQQPLDFETKSQYFIRVRLQDEHELSVEQTFVITVTNVPEAPVELLLSGTVIAEQSPLESLIGTLSTIDPDGTTTFTYELVEGMGDADNASFILVGNELRSAEVFQFETQSEYSVRIRTTDGDGLALDKVFLVQVTDVNEAPTITLGTTPVVYPRKAGPILVLPGIEISDPDTTPGFGVGGGLLRLTLGVVTNKKGTKTTDVFPVAGIPTVGTESARNLTPGQLEIVIELHESTTAADVQQFLRGLTFSAKKLKPASRSLRVQLTDAAGASSEVTQTIQLSKTRAT